MIYVTMLPNNVGVCNRQCACINLRGVLLRSMGLLVSIVLFLGVCGFFVLPAFRRYGFVGCDII